MGFAIFIILLGITLTVLVFVVFQYLDIRKGEVQLKIEQEKTRQFEAALKLVNDFDEKKVRRNLAERKPSQWTEQETTYAVTELLKKSFGTPPAYIVDPDDDVYYDIFSRDIKRYDDL